MRRNISFRFVASKGLMLKNYKKEKKRLPCEELILDKLSLTANTANATHSVLLAATGRNFI
jgi:hypothetical protein